MEPKKTFDKISKFAKEQVDKIDTEAIKETAGKAGGVIKENAGKAGVIIKEKAVDLKDQAVEMKDEINEKLTELDRMLAGSIDEYNTAYTLMNDKGMKLFVERSRSVDLIENVEDLINSIANHPKSFESDFEEIDAERKQFVDSCEFADKELAAARAAAGGTGAGIAAAASVAFMGPTAAMWIATTFGTASTGAAISTLSGAAATNAALAWLGGGALATGGSGMAGGSALLAMAGPIGWTIAGATLLTSIILFSKKRTKLNKEKNEEIEAVKRNIENVKEMDAQITQILENTESIRNGLISKYRECLQMYGADYDKLSDSKKMELGALVNVTKSLAVLFSKTVEQDVIIEQE